MGMLDINEAIEEARRKLEEEKSEYKIVVHPSVISYDYRIAWTWDEMEKRNESNALKDKLRLACGMPGRPYGRPLYSEWKTHWGKDRPLPEIPDWW